METEQRLESVAARIRELKKMYFSFLGECNSITIVLVELHLKILNSNITAHFLIKH